MDKFTEIVQKIAASPVKTAMVRNAPLFFVKDAAAPGASVGLKIFENVAGNIIGAALTGAAAIAISKLSPNLFGSPKHVENVEGTLGKLHAMDQFRLQKIVLLNKDHDRVYKTMLKDEVIGKADRKMIDSAYETMKTFAPNLAADENAARSFLREHATFGVGPSYASLKNLADAEQAVSKASGMGGGGGGS